ncbi:MAG: hybrid sensor histidine kinase/response regulator, partial [Candidatus Neomarinimicrobiota bacterium]
ALLGFSGIIEGRFKERITEEEKEYFRIVRDSGQRLMNTVHEILDISELTAGVVPYNPKIVQLAVPVANTFSELQLKAEEKQLDFKLDNQIGEGTVKVDEPSLVKALSNLFENAIKYTDTGHVHIKLSESSGKYILTVSDTGIGISPDYLGQMYDAFSQESSGYTKKYQGLGLGLSITKSCLDLNTIPIAVESKQGFGTTFTLTFTPAAETKEAPVIEIAQPASGQAVKVKTPKERPVVLLVEDDLNNRKTLQAILKRHYETPYAVSVSAAKEQLREHDVDLILLDLSLEGREDGLDLVAYMKAKDEYKAIPVIAVTAHAFPKDRENALTGGCDDYMSKPIDIEKLLGKISQFVERN